MSGARHDSKLGLLLLALSCSALGGFPLAGCHEDQADGSASGGEAGAGASGGARADGGMGGTAGAARTIYGGDGIWARSAELGVQGIFFILEDSVSNGQPIDDGLQHTDLVSDSFGDESSAPFSLFTEGTTMPCVSGTLTIVTLTDGTPCDPVHDECAWDSQWGGGLGMHLNQAGESSSPAQPWDATAYGVSGFEFTTTGDIGRATLRFKAKDSVHPTEDFCAMVAMGKDRRVQLSKLKHQCWESQGELALDPTRLTDLQWQIVPDAETPHEITNFCVSHVAVF